MSSWILTICMLFFCPSLVFAIDKVDQGLMSQRLTQSLSELKNSVEQLSASDETLALKNTQFKARLNSLQMNFQKLSEDHQALTNAKLKLEENNPGRTRQIEMLEAHLADLDHQASVLKEQIKKVQDNLAKNQKEEGALNDKMSQMLDSSGEEYSQGDSPELSTLRQQKQKEKLAMLKAISQSQDRQGLLQEQILDFQKSTPVFNSSAASNASQKNRLKDQIQQLQKELDQWNALVNDSSRQVWSEGQIHQLEASVSDLERNRNELRNLVEKMQKKAQMVHLNKSQMDEQLKLQSNIEHLKGETKGLQFDLEELQQQMVELDKRKAYLEDLVKK